MTGVKKATRQMASLLALLVNVSNMNDIECAIALS